MDRDSQCKLLEENGWKIINKEPFEIEMWENDKCVAEAKGRAAFQIAYHLEKDNKLPDKKTLEELKSENYLGNCLTVGDLKKTIKDMDDDAKVLIERIEDRYFEQHGWSVLYVKGDHYYQCLEHNEKMDGEWNDKEEYPDLDVSKMKKIDLEDLRIYDQFHTAWCSTKGNQEDDKNLYIHIHY